MKPFINGGESVRMILAKIQSIYAHLKTPGTGISALQASILETTDSWKACTELDIEVAAHPYMSSLGRLTVLASQLSRMERDGGIWDYELEFVPDEEDGDLGRTHPSYVSPKLKLETIVEIGH